MAKIKKINNDIGYMTIYKINPELNYLMINIDRSINDQLFFNWRPSLCCLDELPVYFYNYFKNIEMFYNNITNGYNVMLHYYLSNREIKELKKEIRFYSTHITLYISIYSSSDKIKKYLENTSLSQPCWDIVFSNLHKRIDGFL